MRRLTSLVLASFVLQLIACSPERKETGKYPATKKVDSTDTYFGVAMADPYRWLENDTTAETADWVSRENQVTFGYLKSIPYRDQIKKRMEKLFNYERLSAPFNSGEYDYFYKNSGLQNHNVVYRKKLSGGPPEVFLDPNEFSSDGTTKLAGMSFSKDGSLVAYQISKGGSDWTHAIVIKASDKSVVEDTLRDLKFSGIAWRGNDGFYYSTYDKPRGSQLSAKTQNHKLLYHALGTPQKNDVLIFGGDATPRRYIGGNLTEDEQFLVVTAAISTTGNELYAMDLKDPKGKLVTLVGNFDQNHSVIDHDGQKLIVETNGGAPNEKIVVVDFSHPKIENWRDLIAESENSIQSVSTAGKKLLVSYLKDAQSLVKQFDYKGKFERTVDLPGIGSASGFDGKAGDKAVFYSFTSFTYPPSIYKYDLASGKSALYEKPKVDFLPEDYETRQVFYTSKDSTKIPMFITYKKGTELNGKNPTLLYAYGGFNISLTPNFSTGRIVWLENGGVYAQPCLRGGGEYGEKWHLAGTKMNKQNVFDDFIAAAEYLTKEKYTSPEYLTISGGSNGGLLIGATMTQRPDLARVALPAVGVMDMLRYNKFTAGAGWAYDYGTAEDSKEMFEYLKKYSPLHALKAGTAYPATLVTTADHDDRVVPSHSFKFAATLQEDNAGELPVLIRVDVKSGHSSSNLSKGIELQADQFVFAWYNMGVVPPMVKKGM